MATQSTASKNDRHTRNSGGQKTPSSQRDYNEDEQQSYLARGNEQLHEMLEDREGQAVLVALALGFGIGVALGYGLGGSSQRSERWSDRIAAEGLGRRLLERLDSILPESITSRFEK